MTAKLTVTLVLARFSPCCNSLVWAMGKKWFCGECRKEITK